MRKLNISIQMGNGDKLHCELTGNIRMKVFQNNGRGQLVALRDVLYIFELRLNLLAV